VKISGSNSVPAPRERAWAVLQDPDVLAKCMPGCDALVKTGDNEYQMKMKMALASFSGLFDGRIRIADQSFPDTFRLIVEGSGKVGFLKGDGLLTLIEQGTSTEVRYEGDVHVGGTIAAVGQRLIDSTARMMIKRFFDKLAENAAPKDQSSQAT
jgi:carbon monoxide dehydrogenase subunit G